MKKPTKAQKTYLANTLIASILDQLQADGKSLEASLSEIYTTNLRNQIHTYRNGLYLESATYVLSLEQA